MKITDYLLSRIGCIYEETSDKKYYIVKWNTGEVQKVDRKLIRLGHYGRERYLISMGTGHNRFPLRNDPYSYRQRCMQS